MKIKAVIVDVGGVLVQTLDTSRRTLWETKLHLKPGQLAIQVYQKEPGNLATIGRVTAEKIWLDIKKKYSLTEKEIKKLEHDFYAGDKVNTKFYAFMQQVCRICNTAIISNAWLNAREMYTKKYHLDKIVGQMIISAEEGVRKPNKEIYERALHHLGVKADETIYVDDAFDNISTAESLGIHTVLFADTDQAIEKIKSLLKL